MIKLFSGSSQSSQWTPKLRQWRQSVAYLQYKWTVDFFCFSFNCPFKIRIIYIFLPCNIQWCSPWQGILTTRKLSVLVNLRLSRSGIHHFLMNGQAGWWTFSDQWDYFPACEEVNLRLIFLNCQLVCCWSVGIFKQLFSNFSFFFLSTLTLYQCFAFMVHICGHKPTIFKGIFC